MKYLLYVILGIEYQIDFNQKDILEENLKSKKEKIKSLVEDVTFENADAYSKKLATIKESYFGQAKAPESTENVDTVQQNSNDGNTVMDMSDSMSRYTAAISRGQSRDIYNKQ